MIVFTFSDGACMLYNVEGLFILKIVLMVELLIRLIYLNDHPFLYLYMHLEHAMILENFFQC